MVNAIDQTTGRASAFFAGGKPSWGKLGVGVEDALTSSEAIRLAGLNWQVEKQPIYYSKPTGPDSRQTVELRDSFAVVRQDTGAALGVVGNYYTPFQNAKAFDFMDQVVGDGLAKFETAGALKDGKRVWIMARMPETLQIKGEDVVHPYVLVMNSHDGTSGIKILPISIRKVCWNALTLALRRGAAAGQGLSIVHTCTLDHKIELVKRNLGLIGDKMHEFQTSAQAMASKQLSREQLADYFAKLVEKRSEKQAKDLLGEFANNLHNERNTMPGIGGTVWAAYNAVSEWADHQMRVTGKTAGEKLDNRVTSIWFGPAARFKQNAWESALAMVA